VNETDNAYYTDKTPPLIKTAAFTALSEQEISKMRSFLSITDSRIQDGEVFFYCPNSLNRDIEGDHRAYDSNKPVSTGAALAAGATARREKVETLQADGSSTPAFRVGAKVMWNTYNVSPNQFVLVQVDLK
jgi:hypothetical protein